MTITQERACLRKVAYADKQTAKRYLRRTLAHGNRNRGKTRLAVYRCPYCLAFHLGHR